jgi:hypothetical protein
MEYGDSTALETEASDDDEHISSSYLLRRLLLLLSILDKSQSWFCIWFVCRRGADKMIIVFVYEKRFFLFTGGHSIFGHYCCVYIVVYIHAHSSHQNSVYKNHLIVQIYRQLINNRSCCASWFKTFFSMGSFFLRECSY